MKRSSNFTRLMSAFLAVLMLCGLFGTAAFAETATADFGQKYGYLIPTDSKLQAQCKNYTFYGDAANLYFMLFSTGTSGAMYAVDVFSDPNYSDQSLVASSSGEYGNKGSRPLRITWKFKDNASGTYYGRCYTYTGSDDDIIIDSSTYCTFTVKVNRVGSRMVELGSVRNANGGVSITWNSIGSATGYYVYRKLSSDKSWTRIAKVSSGTVSYVDKMVKSGKTYIYTVKAFDALYNSLYNKSGLTIKYLSQPSISSIYSKGSGGYPSIAWNVVPGASGYRIYRKGGSLSNTSWVRVGTINSGKTCAFTDTTATSTNWRYTYTVRAFSGSTLSDFDDVGTIYQYTKAPNLNRIYNNDGSISLFWKDPSSISTGYVVYRMDPGSSSWVKIASVNDAFYTDSAVVSGKKYTYTVRSVNSTNLSGFNAGGISILYLAEPKLSSLSFSAGGNAYLTWAKVPGATSYAVFRKASAETSWTRVGTISNGSIVTYTDKSAKTSGETYTYTVRAMNGSFYGAYDQAGLSGMWLGIPIVKPENYLTDDGTNAVKISWEAIAGAQSYCVYRKAAGEDSWTVIAGSIADCSYVDTAVTSGTAYTYTVRAQSGSFRSSFAEQTITALFAPKIETLNCAAGGTELTWNAVTGADAYYIYRCEPGGTFVKIGSYADTHFTDTTADGSKPYLYLVRAAAKTVLSAENAAGTRNFVGASGVTAVLNVAAAEGEKTNITVNWTGDAEAQSYEIYRKTVGGEYALLGTAAADETAYKDETVEQGVNYLYAVKAIKEGRIGIVAESAEIKWPFPPIEKVTCTVTPALAAGETAAHIDISWTSVDFAQNYEIYRKTKDGAWELLATVAAGESNTYTDTTAAAETAYFYAVKGVASDRDSLFNEDGVYGILQEPVAVVTPTAALTTNAQDASKLYVTLTWSAAPNAAFYQIYRKAEGDTDYQILYTVFAYETLKYTDTTVENGKTYTYKIVGVGSDGRGSLQDETGVSITVQQSADPA